MTDLDLNIVKDLDPKATLAAYATALADDLESRDETVLGPDSKLAIMALRRLAASI